MSRPTTQETNEVVLTPGSTEETELVGGELAGNQHSTRHPEDDPRADPREGPAEPEPESFPRDYVEQLRDEAAKYRTRAQRADDYAARLHTALTEATGRLADASDLPFDESHVDDPEALTGAIDDLLARKPHLASRRPAGDVGQGATKPIESVDLAGILRARAL